MQRSFILGFIAVLAVGCAATDGALGNATGNQNTGTGNAPPFGAGGGPQGGGAGLPGSGGFAAGGGGNVGNAPPGGNGAGAIGPGGQGGQGGGSFPPGQDKCGDLRPGEMPQSSELAPEDKTYKVLNGTNAPTLLPLTPGQNLAIGKISGCTATLITPTWVLTAHHCNTNAGSQFCMGHDNANPNQCVRIKAVHHAAGYQQGASFANDTTLLELEQSALSVAPDVEPIPIYTENLDDSWIGTQTEGGGYGQTETGSSGVKYFTTKPISELTPFFVRVYGDSGVCYGDSGGPLLALAPDGSIRVLADLSHVFQPYCRSTAAYARIDIQRDWIESFTGPTVIGGQDCGMTTAEGRCENGTAYYCAADDTLGVDRCQNGQTCGWDPNAAGYRCITGADPCGGLDRVGACAGDVAIWCDQGTQKQRDCGACGQICRRDTATGGEARCATDPCNGVSAAGRCTGTIYESCTGGTYQSMDCVTTGQQCGFNENTGRYACL